MNSVGHDQVMAGRPSGSTLRERCTGFRGLLLVIVLTSVSVFTITAQDIHFSQFFNAPLALGPGSIGVFDGQYRVNGIFRQQWRSVTRPYRTFALGGDAADAFGKRGLGLGAWVYNDRAGDSRMQRSHLSLGASWTQRFGEEHALTFGLQGGFTSISIDPGELSFDAQYNGFHYDPSLATGEQFARSSLLHPDLHTGVAYAYRPEARTAIQAGIGLFNLTSPNIGFLGGPGEPLDRRTTVYVRTEFPVATRMDLMPMVQYMAQGTFNELDLGGNLRYILLDRYGLKRAALLGLHYRAADAGYIYAGLEHDDWTFGLSYDINLSDLVPASRNRGGIELTVIRIFRKRPAVPVRFKACPDQL